VIYPVISAKIQLKKTDDGKAFTSVTAIMSIAIVMSTLLSIVIALQAEMPPSIGFGGFYYIFGPGILGIIVLVFYFIGIQTSKEIRIRPY